MNEREQLKRWIPNLFQKKRNNLSISQLRLIHYVLGYNATPGFRELEEVLSEHEIAPCEIKAFLSILKKSGFVVIRKPY